MTIRNLRKVFAAVVVSVLVLLSGVVLYRSSKKITEQSHLSLLSDQAESVREAVKSLTIDEAGLFLQDFHRVEVKNGKPMWEVRARDARYYAGEQLALVTDPALTVYRKKRSKVELKSDAGKLHLDGDSLTRAELEGNIVIQVDESLTFTTDQAVYNRTEGTLTAPGRVMFSGPGYQVEGSGFRLSLVDHTVEIYSDVSSEFRHGAQVPFVIGAENS